MRTDILQPRGLSDEKERRCVPVASLTASSAVRFAEGVRS
jgi:hypothetical protein